MGVKTIQRTLDSPATPAMRDDSPLTFSLPAVLRKKVTVAFDGGLESAVAEGARRRAAIAAACLGEKEALNVTYPAATSSDIIARENAVLAADLAQLSSNRASLFAQRAERLATCDRLKASIAAREKLIAVNKEHVDMRERLNQTKAASRAQVIETLQQYQAQVTAQAG